MAKGRKLTGAAAASSSRPDPVNDVTSSDESSSDDLEDRGSPTATAPQALKAMASPATARTVTAVPVALAGQPAPDPRAARRKSGPLVRAGAGVGPAASSSSRRSFSSSAQKRKAENHTPLYLTRHLPFWREPDQQNAVPPPNTDTEIKQTILAYLGYQKAVFQDDYKFGTVCGWIDRFGLQAGLKAFNLFMPVPPPMDPIASQIYEDTCQISFRIGQSTEAEDKAEISKVPFWNFRTYSGPLEVPSKSLEEANRRGDFQYVSAAPLKRAGLIQVEKATHIAVSCHRLGEILLLPMQPGRVFTMDCLQHGDVLDFMAATKERLQISWGPLVRRCTVFIVGGGEDGQGQQDRKVQVLTEATLVELGPM